MLEHDQIVQTTLPIKEIYIDPDFNCRRGLTTAACIPLANSIEQEGLLNPITVRKLRNVAKCGYPSEKHLVDKGFKYKVIAGHRRLTACKYLEWTDIPVATILSDSNSDFASKTICAIENLHRTDLSLLEEALSIKHYYLFDWKIVDVATAVKKSPSWVTTRYKLLQMPEVIQDLAHEGVLKPADIDRLFKYRDEQDVLIEKAAQAKARNQGVTSVLDALKLKDKKKKEAKQKKIRGQTEIEQMIALLNKLFKGMDEEIDVPLGHFFTPMGNSIGTACLSWAGGFITNEEFYLRLEVLCEKLNIDFKASEYLE